jgi:hypothetical protein
MFEVEYTDNDGGRAVFMCVIVIIMSTYYDPSHLECGINLSPFASTHSTNLELAYFSVVVT